MKPESLAVIGLGAVGGSIAWQARLAGIPRVAGFSPEPAEAALALRSAAITDVASTAEAAIRTADLTVLAAPPEANLALLDQLAPWLRPGALVTDVTSVKAVVVARARRAGLGARFAGSHPLAGTHASGFTAARADLLRGAVVYVTPTSDTDGAAAAREVMNFWSEVLEAEPVLIDAEAHDRQLAWTSHLPQAAASALASVLSRRLGASFGTGARDTTRLAASAPGMWSELFAMNREAVTAALAELEQELATLRGHLSAGHDNEVKALLEQARKWRTGLGAEHPDRKPESRTPREG